MTRPRNSSNRPSAPHVVAATAESEWVNDSERIALAASVQALFVVASRVAASEAVPVEGKLESLAQVLPACLAAAIRASGDPVAVLSSLGAPESAAPFLDQGWALAVGTHRQRLGAPGRVTVAWQTHLRVTPVLGALQGDFEGSFEEKVLPNPGDMRVLPLGDPDGNGATPIRSADEAQRSAGLTRAWEQLVSGAAQLPGLDDLTQLREWVWHFDTFLSVFLHAMPAYWEGLSGQTRSYECTRDTLFDQSRLAGSIGVSLFRYHIRTHHNGPMRTEPEAPLLLISGEMSPIQDYIFGFSPTSPIDADVILRGRSSFLRLVIDVAAYRLCTDLRLPPGSVLLSAASKFTLVAPNTYECREIFKTLQIEFDQWALDQLYGQTGLTLALKVLDPMYLENDYPDGVEWKIRRNHPGLLGVLSQLALRAEDSRFHRFQLCKRAEEESALLKKQWKPPIYLERFQTEIATIQALCAVDGKSPATRGSKRPLSNAAAFQIALADAVAQENPTALLTKQAPSGKAEDAPDSLAILGFDVSVAVKHPSDSSHSVAGQMEWDLRSWSETSASSRWTGRCRKSLALYSSTAGAGEGANSARFRQLLKGDIDRLGIAFQKRIPGLNLSRIAGFSRELETFFSTIVPRQLFHRFPQLLTIYSGGDDFVFVGPPRDMMRFSLWLRREFGGYCNERLSFSAGLSLPFKDTAAIAHAVTEADDALAVAKETRDAMGFQKAAWSWPAWGLIADRMHTIDELVGDNTLAHANIVELAELLYRSATQPLVRSHLGVHIDDILRKQAKRHVDAQMEDVLARETGLLRGIGVRARHCRINLQHASLIANQTRELVREWHETGSSRSTPEMLSAMHELVERILTLRLHCGAMKTTAFKRLKAAIRIEPEPHGIDMLLLSLTLIHATRP